MSNNATKSSPPVFNEAVQTWTEYKKELSIWESLTSLEKQQQGPALYLSLTGRSKDVVRHVAINEITQEDGLKTIVDVLDKVYGKDEDEEACNKTFEDRRQKGENMKDYIESLLAKIKSLIMKIPEGNSAEEEGKLCVVFKFDNMKKELLNSIEYSGICENVFIKDGDVFYGESQQYYSDNRNSSQTQAGWNTTQNIRKVNPPAPDGEVSRCSVCESIYHWRRDCPDGDAVQSSQKTDTSRNGGGITEVDLFGIAPLEAMDEQQIGETIGCAVADNGCSKTMAGEEAWLEDDRERLCERNGNKHGMVPSNQLFKFDKGKEVPSEGMVTLPAVIGLKHVNINVEIANIPMLMSKDTMIRAEEETNLAQECHGAEVLSGEFRDTLFGEYTYYDLERGFTRHLIGEEDKQGIVIDLGRPSIINNISLLLWDKDHRSYSYSIECSLDNKDWTGIVDYSKYLCRANQNIHFPPKVVKYIRVLGAFNSVNRYFHLVTFQCSYTANTPQFRNGIIEPNYNVAFIRAHALLIEGVSRNRNALIDGNTENYDWESGYTCHQIGSGCITIQLAQPYVIGSMRMLLWDCDNREYSFYIEVSLDQQEWVMVADKRNENCRCWQYMHFEERPVSFIKIVGTRNTANEVFHVVHFEAPASTTETTPSLPSMSTHHITESPDPLPSAGNDNTEINIPDVIIDYQGILT